MHTENLKSPRAPRRDHAPSRLRVAVSLQFLIATGDGLAGVALAVRVYQQTHSPCAVTAVLLAAGLPVVLLAPLAGMLLDRVRIGFALVPAAAGMAVAAVGLSMVHGLVATVALVALYGTGDSLLRPGLGAAVPLLAGPGGLIRANSALSAATMSGTALGPLFAGVVSSAGGTRLALLMDAGAYAIAALGLATLRLGRSHVPEHDGSGPARRAMSAGFAYLRADRPLRTLVVVVAVMVAFTNVSVIAELFLAEGTLHAGAAGYAALVTGWTAAMTVGTLVAGRLTSKLLPLAVLLGTVVAGIGIALAGLSPHLWLAVAAYGIGGFGDGVEVVALRSLLNERAPAPVAGRVFTAYTAITVGAASLGMAAAAPLVAVFGTRATLAFVGAAGAAAGVWGLARRAHRALDVPYGHSVVLTPAALRAGAALGGLRPVEQ